MTLISASVVSVSWSGSAHSPPPPPPPPPPPAAHATAKVRERSREPTWMGTTHVPSARPEKVRLTDDFFFTSTVSTACVTGFSTLNSTDSPPVFTNTTVTAPAPPTHAWLCSTEGFE